MIEIIKFGDTSKAIEEGNQKAILELVTRVTAQAKALAPVDLGNLKGSIMGRVEGREVGHEEGPKITERPKEGQGYVGTAVLYGIYQEFGTRRMRAQPYLRPAIAIEANGQRTKDVVKQFENQSVKQESSLGAKKRKVIK